MAARILQWICRLVLGGLFLYAGFTKVYPPNHRLLFEMALSAYRLLPVWAVIGVAAVLPWVEMVLGVLLIGGWKLRYVAAFTSVLLGTFLAAMGITYARGIEADCGCFGLGEPISAYTLGRDSLLWLMAVYLAVAAWRRRPTASSGSPGSGS